MDVLRIIACIMVICIHVSAEYLMIADLKSTLFLESYLIDSISRVCIPIFLMITGALWLKKKSVSIIDMCKLSFKTLCLFFAWNAFYALRSGIDNYWKSLSEGIYHLWYLLLISVLYIIIAVLSLVEDKNKKYLIYFCLIFGVVLSFISKFAGNNNLFGDVVNPTFIAYIGYLLIGYDLSNRKGSFVYLIIFILMSIVYGCTGVAISLNNGEASFPFFDYDNIVVFVNSILLFISIKSIFSFKSKIASVISAFISNLTFGVYLVHVLVILVFKHCGILEILSVWQAIGIVFLISIFISFVMSKIPYIRCLVSLK